MQILSKGDPAAPCMGGDYSDMLLVTCRVRSCHAICPLKPRGDWSFGPTEMALEGGDGSPHAIFPADLRSYGGGTAADVRIGSGNPDGLGQTLRIEVLPRNRPRTGT